MQSGTDRTTARPPAETRRYLIGDSLNERVHPCTPAPPHPYPPYPLYPLKAGPLLYPPVPSKSLYPVTRPLPYPPYPPVPPVPSRVLRARFAVCIAFHRSNLVRVGCHIHD